MPTTLRDSAGRYAGSIGAGRDAAPAAPPPPPVAAPALPTRLLDVHALGDAYDALLADRPQAWEADDRAVATFTGGGCWILAQDLHRATGWPLVLIATSEEVQADGTRTYGWVHALVRSPDGRLVDIEGAHDPDEVWDAWGAAADDAAADDAAQLGADADGRWPDLVEVGCTQFEAAAQASRDDPALGEAERDAVALSPAVVPEILRTWFPAERAAHCTRCA